MSQSTLSIANGTGAAVRSALNTALQAQASNQSGSSAASTLYPYQFWADTSDNRLKIRNSANDAWLEAHMALNTGLGTFEDGTASLPGFHLRTDVDCGLYKVGTNAIGISTAGVSRLTISATGVVTIPGDLTVSGTTTTIDTTNLDVEDKNITLGKVSSPSDTTADGGGLTLKGATDKTFNWVDSTDAWTSSEHIHLGDNKKLLLGTGSDLELFHDGTNSWLDSVNNQPLFIRAGTGICSVQGGEIYLSDEGNSHTYLHAVSGGSTQLYYDNSLKFKTNNAGAIYYGTLNTADDGKATYGDSDDLQIYHSTNSYIVNGTGQLQIKVDEFRVLNNAGSENMIDGSADGDVNLYYDGNLRLSTTSAGVNIGGNLSSDSGSSFTINAGGASGSAAHFIARCAAENAIVAVPDAQVELYYNGVLHLATSSYGFESTKYCSVGNGTWAYITGDNSKSAWGNDQDLLVYHDGTNNYIDAVNNHATIIKSGTSDLFLQGNPVWITDEGNSHTYFKGTSGGSTELYNDNVKMFYTSASGVHVCSGASAAHLHLLDGGIVRLGSGEDLTLFHNGTNSFIDSITGNLYIRYNSGNFIQCTGSTGQVDLSYGNSVKWSTTSYGCVSWGDIRPGWDDNVDLGASGARWDDVYATNGTINTSDKNEKNTIVTSDLGLTFVNKLKPVSYKFNNKKRTHYGLIAQDIETTLSDISKSTADFAGFIKEDDKYGLRYHEFIAPMIKAIQELSVKVSALEAA